MGYYSCAGCHYFPKSVSLPSWQQSKGGFELVLTLLSVCVGTLAGGSTESGYFCMGGDWAKGRKQGGRKADGVGENLLPSF